MDVTVTIPQLIGGFVAAMGIPSAVTGLIVWAVKRHTEKRAKNATDKADARESLMILLVQSVGASLALGEATAKAIQRIPDAHCNGDMHEALEYASKAKHSLKSSLQEQGVHSMF